MLVKRLPTSSKGLTHGFLIQNVYK